MPNIAIIIAGAGSNAGSPGEPPTALRLFGNVVCEGDATSLTWVVEPPFSSSAEEINQACINAAIGKLAEHGITVACDDIKRVIGGTVPNLS